MRRFRNTQTHSAGADAGETHQGRIVNINLVNWTVDVASVYDRKKFFDIQVATPYAHFNSGEGFFAFPEVGAIVNVSIPSDSSPPFVSSFLMPYELVDSSSEDAPMGTRSRGAVAKNATDASFAGGRPKAKPGDMGLRGRDGNFVLLHRGGVLQIGSTELSQRLYIPLNNLISDISENYSHVNAAGAVFWGLQDGPSQTHFPAQYLHTFRVFADDKYADVRVAVGKVYNPIPEPDGGTTLAAANVGQSEDSPIICEVTVSPKGFVVENGDPATPSTGASSVFKFVFDRTGNTLLRTEGNFSSQVKKKLTLSVTGDIVITGAASMTVTTQGSILLDSQSEAHIRGKLTRLGPGKRPVARLADIVNSFITAMPAVFIPSVPIPTSNPSAIIATGTPIIGIFSIGSPPTGVPSMPIPGTIKTAEATVLT